MIRRSIETTFQFNSVLENRLLVLTPNGGSVTVSVWDGVAWVQSDVLANAGTHQFYAANLLMRFTPTGGAVFAINAVQSEVL